MFILLEFKEEALADYLNSALRRYGLDCYVFNVGVAPDGAPLFCVACLQQSEMNQARHLIYTSQAFIQDIHPEAAAELRTIRRQNNQVFMSAVTSKPVIVISVILLVVAALGYALGY